jgi:hypothetical protein
MRDQANQCSQAADSLSPLQALIYFSGTGRGGKPRCRSLADSIQPCRGLTFFFYFYIPRVNFSSSKAGTVSFDRLYISFKACDKLLTASQCQLKNNVIFKGILRHLQSQTSRLLAFSHNHLQVRLSCRLLLRTCLPQEQLSRPIHQHLFPINRTTHMLLLHNPTINLRLLDHMIRIKPPWLRVKLLSKQLSPLTNRHGMPLGKTLQSSLTQALFKIKDLPQDRTIRRTFHMYQILCSPKTNKGNLLQ